MFEVAPRRAAPAKPNSSLTALRQVSGHAAAGRSARCEEALLITYRAFQADTCTDEVIHSEKQNTGLFEEHKTLIVGDFDRLKCFHSLDSRPALQILRSFITWITFPSNGVM